jgi:hypothetical protein
MSLLPPCSGFIVRSNIVSVALPIINTTLVYQEYYLAGSDSVQPNRNLLMFRRNVLLSSSRSKSNQRRQVACRAALSVFLLDLFLCPKK